MAKKTVRTRADRTPEPESPVITPAEDETPTPVAPPAAPAVADAEGRLPYRMKPAGKFVIQSSAPGGTVQTRRAEPGEVVLLTPAQARAFADQFEPV